MAKKIIKAQMKQRIDTEANWASKNPVLLLGELGMVSDDPNLYKVGDGVTAWNALPFRGFDGTLAQTTGNSETAAMSQKSVTAELNRIESALYNYIAQPLQADKAFNAYGLKPGDTYTGKIGTASGVYANKFTVNEGETYRLKGKGNLYAYRGYFLTDADNVITRIIALDSYDESLTIAAGERVLYCNLINYDAASDGVWKFDEMSVPKFINDFNARVITKVERVNSSPVLEQCYNTSGVAIGSKYTSTPSNYGGYAYIRTNVKAGETYILKGIGSPDAFRFYAFFDSDMKLVAVSSGDFNSRSTPLEIKAPQGAEVIIINFKKYDPDSDGFWVKHQYSIEGLDSIMRKPWEGKHLVTFGDSLTQFLDSSKTNWPQWLQQQTGAQVTNVAIGGTQIRVRTTPTQSPSNDTQGYAGLDIYSLIQAATTQDFAIPEKCAAYIKANASPLYDPTEVVSRLKSIDWNSVDAVIIFGGTNDWNNGANLGQPGSTAEDTTLGAINGIINKLLSAYPHLQLYWITPPVRYVGTSSNWTEATWAGNTKNSEGKTLPDYIDAITSEVAAQGIPVCDLYRTLGWNQYNFTFYFNSSDGTHPDRGLQYIARKIESFIKSNWTIKD